MKKLLILLPVVVLAATGLSHAQNAAPDRDRDGVPDALDACPSVAGPASNKGCPVEGAAKVAAKTPTATPKSDFEIEAAKALENFKPAAPKAPAASKGKIELSPNDPMSPAYRKPLPFSAADFAAPNTKGLPPARPVFQKGAFNLTSDKRDEKTIPIDAIYPRSAASSWPKNYGIGVRAAQLRLGLDTFNGGFKPQMSGDYDATIPWLLCPSDWGQMVVDANKALDANPNDALALAKRAAGFRFAYPLDLLPANAQSLDVGLELNPNLSKSDLEAMFKLPPMREALPYVLAALRVNQWAPSADDLQSRKVSRVKATLDKLQLLNRAYAFFAPVAPEAVTGRVELYGRTALAMHLENDPNAPKQAQAVESLTAQVLAQQPKSPLALWRFVVANPAAKPGDAKTIFAGIGDKSAGADTAARIAQTFWSVPGQFERGASWGNFAFEMAGPGASPLVKWVKVQATSAGKVRFPVPPDAAFGLSLFEADKVEALELVAQNAGERGELTLARRALEEAIIAGAPPRFWMLLSSAAEVEANTKTGQEAEVLWVEALNANRIATRFQFPGDERVMSEIGANNRAALDELTVNTDKAGELDPLPARYAQPSPLVAARLHGAWLLDRADQTGGGYGYLETIYTLEINASRTVGGPMMVNGEIVGEDKVGKYEMTLGGQSAIALHRRFVRAQIAKTPDREENLRDYKFNRKKLLEKYLADLIKMSDNRADNR